MPVRLNPQPQLDGRDPALRRVHFSLVYGFGKLMNGLMGDGVAAGSDGFRVTENWVERVVVVAPSGDLDMLSAPVLATAVYAAARKEPAAMIVDLTGINFLASAGMNLLVDVHREITRTARFAIVADSPATSRPLMLTGIDDMMTVFRSIDEALEAFAQA